MIYRIVFFLFYNVAFTRSLELFDYIVFDQVFRDAGDSQKYSIFELK